MGVKQLVISPLTIATIFATCSCRDGNSFAFYQENREFGLSSSAIHIWVSRYRPTDPTAVYRGAKVRDTLCWKIGARCGNLDSPGIIWDIRLMEQPEQLVIFSVVGVYVVPLSHPSVQWRFRVPVLLPKPVAFDAARGLAVVVATNSLNFVASLDVNSGRWMFIEGGIPERMDLAGGTIKIYDADRLRTYDTDGRLISAF